MEMLSFISLIYKINHKTKQKLLRLLWRKRHKFITILVKNMGLLKLYGKIEIY
jgi:hypothetical protein